jgi:hypothetical protein
MCVSPVGAGAPEEDELYESGVVESNCLYRLVENRLVPHEQAWAAIPTVSLLGPTEVSPSLDPPVCFCGFSSIAALVLHINQWVFNSIQRL